MICQENISGPASDKPTELTILVGHNVPKLDNKILKSRASGDEQYLLSEILSLTHKFHTQCLLNWFKHILRERVLSAQGIALMAGGNLVVQHFAPNFYSMNNSSQNN